VVRSIFDLSLSGKPGELQRGEWAVLGLLAERPTHGWALSKELSPTGEIGQIWSGDRQRIYRALHKLVGLGLVEAVLTEPGGGAQRNVYRPTALGLEQLRLWLDEPVGHSREAQSTFVLKLALSQRAGIDPTPLLRAQRATIAATVASLAHKLERTDRSQGPPVHLMVRLETTRALLTVIDSLSAAVSASTQPPRPLRSGPRPLSKSGGPLSDFSGIELSHELDTATIILRFGDPQRGVHVAHAHVDDGIVEEITAVAREAGSSRVVGEH
jgi:PadR family transcriptional regulator AphA